MMTSFITNGAEILTLLEEAYNIEEQTRRDLETSDFNKVNDSYRKVLKEIVCNSLDGNSFLEGYPSVKKNSKVWNSSRLESSVPKKISGYTKQSSNLGMEHRSGFKRTLPATALSTPKKENANITKKKIKLDSRRYFRGGCKGLSYETVTVSLDTTKTADRKSVIKKPNFNGSAMKFEILEYITIVVNNDKQTKTEDTVYPHYFVDDCDESCQCELKDCPQENVSQALVNITEHPSSENQYIDCYNKYFKNTDTDNTITLITSNSCTTTKLNTNDELNSVETYSKEQNSKEIYRLPPNILFNKNINTSTLFEPIPPHVPRQTYNFEELSADLECIVNKLGCIVLSDPDFYVSADDSKTQKIFVDSPDNNVISCSITKSIEYSINHINTNVPEFTEENESDSELSKSVTISENWSTCGCFETEHTKQCDFNNRSSSRCFDADDNFNIIDIILRNESVDVPEISLPLHDIFGVQREKCSILQHPENMKLSEAVIDVNISKDPAESDKLVLDFMEENCFGKNFKNQELEPVNCDKETISAIEFVDDENATPKFPSGNFEDIDFIKDLQDPYDDAAVRVPENRMGDININNTSCTEKSNVREKERSTCFCNILNVVDMCDVCATNRANANPVKLLNLSITESDITQNKADPTNLYSHSSEIKCNKVLENVSEQHEVNFQNLFEITHKSFKLPELPQIDFQNTCTDLNFKNFSVFEQYNFQNLSVSGKVTTEQVSFCTHRDEVQSQLKNDNSSSSGGTEHGVSSNTEDLSMNSKNQVIVASNSSNLAIQAENSYSKDKICNVFDHVTHISPSQAYAIDSISETANFCILHSTENANSHELVHKSNFDNHKLSVLSNDTSETDALHLEASKYDTRRIYNFDDAKLSETDTAECNTEKDNMNVLQSGFKGVKGCDGESNDLNMGKCANLLQPDQENDSKINSTISSWNEGSVLHFSEDSCDKEKVVQIQSGTFVYEQEYVETVTGADLIVHAQTVAVSSDIQEQLASKTVNNNANLVVDTQTTRCLTSSQEQTVKNADSVTHTQSIYITASVQQVPLQNIDSLKEQCTSQSVNDSNSHTTCTITSSQKQPVQKTLNNLHTNGNTLTISATTSVQKQSTSQIVNTKETTNSDVQSVKRPATDNLRNAEDSKKSKPMEKTTNASFEFSNTGQPGYDFNNYKDAQEIADNNDPKWKNYNLNNPEECFKSVCTQWELGSLPDPHEDLTLRHHYRSVIRNKYTPFIPTNTTVCLSIYKNVVEKVMFEKNRLQVELESCRSNWNNGRIANFQRKIDELHDAEHRLRSAYDDALKFYKYFVNAQTGWSARYTNANKIQEAEYAREIINSSLYFYGH